MKVRLWVFLPMKCGLTEARTFAVEADKSLQWFREHADELARLSLRQVGVAVDSYTALNIEAFE